MKLVPITTQRAVELIAQGIDSCSRLWWVIRPGTIGNYRSFSFPKIERISKTEGFIEEDGEE